MFSELQWQRTQRTVAILAQVELRYLEEGVWRPRYVGKPSHREVNTLPTLPRSRVFPIAPPHYPNFYRFGYPAA